MTSSFVSNKVAFCVTDLQRKIISCSKDFVELTGFKLKEIINKNCNFLQGSKTDQKTVSLMRRNFEQQLAGDYLIENYTKNGQFFWNYLRVVPLRDSLGEVRYFAGFQMAVGNDPGSKPDIDELEQLDCYQYDSLWLHPSLEHTQQNTNDGPNQTTASTAKISSSIASASGSDSEGDEPYASVSFEDGIIKRAGPVDTTSIITYSGSDAMILNIDRIRHGPSTGDVTEAKTRTATENKNAEAATSIHSSGTDADEKSAAAAAAALVSPSLNTDTDLDIDLIEPKINLGVSSCLMGEAVRWNGQDARNKFIVDQLAPYLERIVTSCPEVGVGMPTPRPTCRLVCRPDSKHDDPFYDPIMYCPKTGHDYTDQMKEWCATELERLSKEKLSGFIFKSNSPSSGLFAVKVYASKTPGAVGTKKGMGLFARAFTERFPLIPVEEEGRLQDPPLRENFVNRIFAFGRLRTVARLNPTIQGIRKFHRSMRLTYMLHAPATLDKMDIFINSREASALDFQQLCTRYCEFMMQCMTIVTGNDSHVRVWRYCLELLSQDLTKRDIQELESYFDDCRRDLIPLIVPMTLLKHHINRLACAPDWLRNQWYFNRGPKEFKLWTYAGPSNHRRKAFVGDLTGSSCSSCTGCDADDDGGEKHVVQSVEW